MSDFYAAYYETETVGGVEHLLSDIRLLVCANLHLMVLPSVEGEGCWLAVPISKAGVLDNVAPKSKARFMPVNSKEFESRCA